MSTNYNQKVFSDEELKNPEIASKFISIAAENIMNDSLFVGALKRVAKIHGFICYKTPDITKDMNNVEPLYYTDNATPDEGYVIRILEAHLHNTNVQFRLDGDFSEGTKKLYTAMNEAADKRAKMLRIAINCLEQAKIHGAFK